MISNMPCPNREAVVAPDAMQATLPLMKTWSASVSEASVAPDGPLPMMPTVLIAVLISRNWFQCLVTNAGLFARFVRPVNIKS